MALTIRALDPSYATLGVALHFLARRPPFSGFRFGDLTQTVDDQIRRRHALFAFDDRRVVGYLGWHLYDHAEARDFAQTGRPPPLERPDGADVAWVMTAAAAAPQTLIALVEAGKAQNVGRRAMGVRYRKNGKRVIFDQVIAPRRTKAPAPEPTERP
ncbi:hypothetical protein [Methylobacterium sp. Leaf118]|uniref:hypothetical protein n=1 Tax=Methylobacterium sp. Leaf118 TaxID=2876562 RepID=UPI001E58D4F1|nr:hypothetical protein [Methylobacterium sp. Leaf118]